MKKFINEFIKDENGLNTLEYVALAFGLLLAVLGAVRVLGGTTGKRFEKLNEEMIKTN